MSGREGETQSAEVRTRGLSWYDRTYIVAALVGALIGYPLVSFAVIDPGLVPLSIRLSIWTVVLLAFFLWMENTQGIRRVQVDSSGVTFHYLLRRKFGRWRDLSVGATPQPDANRIGGIYLSRSFLDRGRPDAWLHFVTRDQARAILLHPTCTIKDLEPGVRAYLGL